MPVLTMASAASRMILSVTWFSQMYQLFQPMCGVRARVSPQTIRNGRLAVPRRIGDLEDDIVSARAVEPAADLAGLRVELEPLGQPLGRVAERPLAGGRDLEQERRAGPDAEDPSRRGSGAPGPAGASGSTGSAARHQAERGHQDRERQQRPAAERDAIMSSSSWSWFHSDAAERPSSWASISSRVFPLVSGSRRRMKTNPARRSPRRARRSPPDRTARFRNGTCTSG